MKHWKSEVEIYDTAVIHLVLASNIAEAQNNFKDIRGAGDSENCRGFFICCWPNFYIFLNEGWLNKRTISHEIFHATMAIMREVGVKSMPGNDEPYAYMTDWLTGWVYRKLGNRNIPNDKKRSGPGTWQRFRNWLILNVK